jgi:anti-anti-sigma factor
MMPVPKGWDGEAIEKEKILGHVGSFQALTNRTEGKGCYQLRIISHDDHQLMQRMRLGKTNEETLSIDIKHAGMVTTFHLAGGIGVTSAAKLQTAIMELPDENNLILLDCTRLSYFVKTGSGILHTVLKSVSKKGKVIHIVVKPNSHIQETLVNSKIDQEFAIFDNREDAVSSLLATTIE